MIVKKYFLSILFLGNYEPTIGLWHWKTNKSGGMYEVLL